MLIQIYEKEAGKFKNFDIEASHKFIIIPIHF